MLGVFAIVGERRKLVSFILGSIGGHLPFCLLEKSLFVRILLVRSSRAITCFESLQILGMGWTCY